MFVLRRAFRCVGVERLEHPGELSGSVEESGLNGSLRAVEGLTDFANRTVLLITEEEGRPLIGIESREGFDDGLSECAPVDGLVEVVHGGGLQHLLEFGDGRVSGPDLQSTVLVLTHIVGNGEDPGRERSPGVKGLGTLYESEEEVLQKVLRLVVISAKHPVEIVDESETVALVEDLECVFVAALNAAHQRFVGQL